MMNKCQNCGTEFDGNFCPKCGTPADGVSKPEVSAQPAAADIPPQMVEPVMQGETPAPPVIPQPVASEGTANDMGAAQPPVPQPENSGAAPFSIPQPVQGPGMNASPVQQAPEQPAPGAVPPPAPGAVPPYAAPVQPPKKKKNTCLIVGLCVGIPILLVIIVGVIVGIVAFKNVVEDELNNYNIPGYHETEGHRSEEDDGDVVSFQITGDAVEQNNVSVRVDQIDYASDQTRIRFTIDNQSNATFYVYPTGVTVTVDGVEYENEYDFSGRYTELPTDIAAGEKVSGIIFFPALDPYADMQITMESFSDDYRLDFGDYEFTITG